MRFGNSLSNVNALQPDGTSIFNPEADPAWKARDWTKWSPRSLLT